MMLGEGGTGIDFPPPPFEKSSNKQAPPKGAPATYSRKQLRQIVARQLVMFPPNVAGIRIQGTSYKLRQ